MCLTSTETTRFIRDGEEGVGCMEVEVGEVVVSSDRPFKVNVFIHKATAE